MNTSLLEFLPELVEVILFTLGSIVLSLSGAYIEQTALALAGSGQLKLAAFVAWFGIVAFVFAYLLATDKARPKVVELLQSLPDG